MSEKEKEKWLDIINDFEHDFAAIAAYQLTRIADQGEPLSNLTAFVDGDAPDALVEAGKKLFQALIPFADAAQKYKAKLPRPILEDALDDSIEIEAGFCENAWQAIENYQKVVNCATHEKAVRDGT